MVEKLPTKLERRDTSLRYQLGIDTSGVLSHQTLLRHSNMFLPPRPSLYLDEFEPSTRFYKKRPSSTCHSFLTTGFVFLRRGYFIVYYPPPPHPQLWRLVYFIRNICLFYYYYFVLYSMRRVLSAVFRIWNLMGAILALVISHSFKQVEDNCEVFNWSEHFICVNLIKGRFLCNNIHKYETQTGCFNCGCTWRKEKKKNT